MSKYIKVFDTVEEYNAYSGGTAFTSPNISYIKSTDETKYDDNEIKHYTKDSWIEVSEESGTTLNKIINYITSVTVPNGITIIGESTFYSCGLTSINLPSSLTTIKGYAFYQANNISSLIIPSGVIEIGSMAFHNCANLANFTIKATTPPTLGSGAFDGTTLKPSFKIYVPDESVDAYKSATNWSSLSDRIKPISEKPNN